MVDGLLPQASYLNSATPRTNTGTESSGSMISSIIRIVSNGGGSRTVVIDGSRLERGGGDIEEKLEDERDNFYT